MTIYPYKQGSNQYVKTRKTNDINAAIAIALALPIVIAMLVKVPDNKTTLFLKSIEFKVSPALVVAAELQVPGMTAKPLTIDEMVHKYSMQYGKNFSQQTRIKVMIHFLLRQEAGYGTNKGHGDNGKAGGPLQYHQPTWDGFRKIMMKKGLVKEIGSRYDMEQAIETTAWAIADGREDNWGPILRDEIKL